ncbi:MAG: 2-oxoglutarate dehydrogenase E1 component, partial [Calditrichaceae bacterium]
NEGDEPRFTQPKLYTTIAKHPDPRKIYYDKLLEGGKVEKGLAAEMESEYKKLLQQSLSDVKTKKVSSSFATYLDQCDRKKKFSRHTLDPKPVTKVDEEELNKIAERVFIIPDHITPLQKVAKIYDDRKQRYSSGNNLDWAMGEFLTYGTLVNESCPVRLSGQDSERGTFSHRHAIVHSADGEKEFSPINNISDVQAKFTVYNSPLSEYGVLGFDYGYACANPSGLTIWEAQFGDFSNGAQIIIDQFIASSAIKWNRSNGIVLYLPHGYEGQGPEHSSARIERFLNLCANENMRVANCTTPANLFHLLRSQTKYPFRLPLVIFTPKSLLRHPECVSSIKDFTEGEFLEVIDDNQVDKNKAEKLIFCSGKVYYDLIDQRKKIGNDNTAIVRIEQLYPLPEQEIETIVNAYKNVKKHVWLQEEPANAGAFAYMLQHFKIVTLEFVSRQASATPATGFHKHHNEELDDILSAVFM